jgi:hypothetical protein
VEHWHCQDRYPSEALDYQNLLGVCRGNEGQAAQQETCDTRKKNKDLRYNPANPAHDVERRVRYLGNGRMESDESVLDAEINEVLNLNHSRLVENRKAVMDAVIERLGSRPGTRPPAEIRRLRDWWSTPKPSGKLREYCGVAVYFLNKRLNRQVPSG